MAVDNTKSQKKPGFHPNFRRYIFEKTKVKFTPAPLPIRLVLKEIETGILIHYSI